ncbi:MAG: hypothetical protein V7636_643 [Actinomycetota bacterium]
MRAPAVCDVVVVGGGPAGLASALWLGRHRFRTVVVDRGEPRNRWVDETFGYLGFDATPPDELLRAARRDLERYPEVTRITSGVRAAHRQADRFLVEADDEQLDAAAIVFATGVVDAVPPLPGLREHYGTSVFVCPLCDGYEVAGTRVAVLGAGGTAGAFAAELLRWARCVTVVPLGEERPTDDLPSSVSMAPARATAVEGTTSGIDRIALSDGSAVPTEVIFLRSDTIAVTDLAAHLGCDRNDEGLLVVDADGCTSLPRVYAAGDCTPGPQLVQVAAAEGARAGLHCARTLMADRCAGERQRPNG